MESDQTIRPFALAALGFGLAALGVMTYLWLLNPPPASASCETRDGYAAIKSHAETNGSLALLALLCTALAAITCFIAAAKDKEYRPLFILGVVPLVLLGLWSIAWLIGSGLYCQN